MKDTQTEQSLLPARYDFDEIDLDAGSVHADVVRLVGESARVLELGPATGYMSRAFVNRGCTVVGVETDAKMAERAAEFCERVVVGDLDVLDLEAELGEDRFDAIVAADVLEHLKDPLGVLKRLRPFLKPDGCFVISVPNVAHGSVRLALLSGHFDYQDIGLLDSTHLRFFTRETLEQLLDEAELGLAELHRHELNLDASEVPFDPAAVPAEMRDELEHDPEARTYQFVVKAIAMEREGLRELQRRLSEVAELRLQATRVAELEKSLRELQRRLSEVAELRLQATRVAELEKTLADIAGREGELRRALIEAHDQLLRRDGELEEALALRIRLGQEALALRIRLDSILASPPARIYAALRKLPGLRAIDRQRQAQVDAEFAKRAGPSA